MTTTNKLLRQSSRSRWLIRRRLRGARRWRIQRRLRRSQNTPTCVDLGHRRLGSIIRSQRRRPRRRLHRWHYRRRLGRRRRRMNREGGICAIAESGINTKERGSTKDVEEASEGRG